MLEYSKTILSKVSFDPSLFKKELTNSLNWINNNEKKILLQWCLIEFGNKYYEDITLYLGVYV